MIKAPRKLFNWRSSHGMDNPTTRGNVLPLHLLSPTRRQAEVQRTRIYGLLQYQVVIYFYRQTTTIHPTDKPLAPERENSRRLSCSGRHFLLIISRFESKWAVQSMAEHVQIMARYVIQKHKLSPRLHFRVKSHQCANGILCTSRFSAVCIPWPETSHCRYA